MSLCETRSQFSTTRSWIISSNDASGYIKSVNRRLRAAIFNHSTTNSAAELHSLVDSDRSQPVQSVWLLKATRQATKCNPNKPATAFSWLLSRSSDSLQEISKHVIVFWTIDLVVDEAQVDLSLLRRYAIIQISRSKWIRVSDPSPSLSTSTILEFVFAMDKLVTWYISPEFCALASRDLWLA